MPTSGFQDYCRRKEAEATAATLTGFTTVSEEARGADLLSFGNAWTRRLFDGDFHRSAGASAPDLPVVSLVLTHEPGAREATVSGLATGHLGCGPTAAHLVQEGLSRVDADAVLGGLGPAPSDHVCSVWHPELVALRAERGLPRHPAQIVVTNSGELPFETCLLFHEPSLRVVVVTRTSAVPTVRARLRLSPWVEVLDAGETLDLRAALTRLRAEGVAVVSAVGGPRVAATLLHAGLVTDLYVISCGPSSPAAAVSFYDGPPFLRRRLLAKAGRGSERAVRFEHLVQPGVYAPGLRMTGPAGVLR